MAIMETDFSIITKRHEVEFSQKYNVILSRISTLETPLNDVYGSRQPSTNDYAKRRALIRDFNLMAREIYGSNDECPIVEEFGSFLMDMFDANSDLDMSISFGNRRMDSRRDIIKTLRKFAEKFDVLQKQGHVKNVQPIFSARVPVLKVTECGSSIECDFSVGNMDGVAKSHILLLISAIDERFQKLSVLVKAWAKAQDINSSRDGTLNSLSLILLVALHLQTREPPILPPFSAIFRDGSDPAAVKKNVPHFLNYGKDNKESLAELFVSLLIKLESVETLWPQGLCASTYEGSWIYKTWKTKKGRDKKPNISIEDFRDRSENTARAVRPKKISKIYTCIRRSLQHIHFFISGGQQINDLKLKSLLFDPNPSLIEKKSGCKRPPKIKRLRLKEGAKGGKMKAEEISTPKSCPKEVKRSDKLQVTCSGNHANRPIQVSSEIRPERSHASHGASNFPVPSPYPLAPRSSSGSPHHLSYPPHSPSQPRYYDPRQSSQPRYYDPRQSSQPRYYDLQQSSKPRYHDPRQSSEPRYYDPQQSSQPRYYDPRQSLNPMYYDPPQSLNPMSYNHQQSLHPSSYDHRQSINPRSFDRRQSLNPRSFDSRQSSHPSSYDPRQSYPHVPSPYSDDFHAHDIRNPRMPVPYGRSRNAVHIIPNPDRNHGGANGAQPHVYHRR